MKQRAPIYILLLIVMVSWLRVEAQDINFGVIRLNAPRIINFSALSDSQTAHPLNKAKEFIEQGEDRFEDFKFKPAIIKAGSPVFSVPVNTLKSSVNSSPPLLSFPAIQDYGVLIPPDIQGAAGVNYILETTNQEFDVFNKSGALIKAVSLTGFFSSTHGARFFDPHVLYDAARGRFIICCDGLYQNGNGGLFVAVSATNDPTGNWLVYSFDAAGNSTDFIDYPEMGFNNKWIVLTANNFIGSDTVNAKIYVLRADSLYAGNLSAVKVFTDTASYSIVPAQTNDTGLAGIYLVHDANGNQNGNGYMQIGSITGAADAPVYNFGHSIGINQPWSENVLNAIQNGGDNTIEDGDTRVMNGVIFNQGSLWFTHNVFLPADSPTHTAVDWWQVDPAALAVQQFGRIEDASQNTFYFYPSLAVNARNDMLLGYCISSTSYYPSAAYSLRLSTDPVNTLRNTYTYQFGMGSYDKTFGSRRNRWGDFTGTSVDPVDSTFWNFNQYSGITNSWATTIAHIADGTNSCKAKAAFVYSTGLSCGAPFAVNFTNLSTSAGNSYWDFGDGTTSASLNPSHSYTAAGAYSVNLVVSDSICGTDSVYKQSIVHITDEDPVTSPVPSICAGQTAALYATGPGVIYWYRNLTDLHALDTGSIFITSAVFDTSIYYAQSHIPGPVTNCGPINNTFGPILSMGTYRQHLVVFDCKYPQRLVSVDVYANGAGYCHIVLLDPNNSVLGSVNPYLENGQNTVMLNFDLPVDHDLKLTTQDSVSLFYNTGAAYPYYSTDSSLVLIHSDQVTTTDYFYFYNWKLETACLSNRIPVQVNVINPGTHFDYEDAGDNKITFIPANANASYCRWLFGDGSSSEQTFATHSYAAPGIYPVQLIEHVEGCSDSIVEAVAVDTGTENSSLVQSVFIYPDPVKGQLNLRVGLKQPANCTLLVRDVLGQTLVSRSLALNPGINNAQIDVNALPAGMFFISLRNGKAIVTRHFIKAN